MTVMPPDFATGVRLSVFNGANAAAGAETLLRRSLINAARDYDVQMQIDCAELALAAGRDDAARSLYELVFLRLGFAPEQLDRQRDLACHTGLWPIEDIPAADYPDRPAFSVDAALAELTALQAIPLSGLPEHGADLFEMPDFGPTASAVERISAPAAAGACSALCNLLRQSEPAEDLGGLLDRLRDTLDEPLPLADRVGADLPDLIDLFVYGSLRDFVRRHHDIAFAPFGSPSLFHAAARLDPGALGPWFRNAGNVIRTSRDIVGLIQHAAGDDDMPAAIDRWSVLLAIHLPAAHRLDLVDELADLGRMRAIWALLAAAARRLPEHEDLPLLWRVRDAGLDCSDAPLGIAAQRLATELAKNNRIEWIILAEIYATIGDDESAEAMIARALAIDPDDRGIFDRLAALRQGRFSAYAVTGGFGTSKGRQQLRFARWGGAPRAA